MLENLWMILRWGIPPKTGKGGRGGGNLATFGQGVSQENALEIDMTGLGEIESSAIWKGEC